MSMERSLKIEALKYNILSAFSASSVSIVRACSKPVTVLVLLLFVDS